MSRNTSKDKGDRGEREAAPWWVDNHPDLVLPKAKRMLGAGRQDDEGDLRVLPDVAVQVKNFARPYLGKALREAALGATVQAGNGDMPWAVGMVVNPGVRKDKVRWFASVEVWPIPGKEHTVVGDAVQAARLVTAAGRDSDLTVQVIRKGTEPIIVACLPAWVTAYRTATGRIAPA